MSTEESLWVLLFGVFLACIGGAIWCWVSLEIDREVRRANPSQATPPAPRRAVPSCPYCAQPYDLNNPFLIYRPNCHHCGAPKEPHAPPSAQPYGTPK